MSLDNFIEKIRPVVDFKTFYPFGIYDKTQDRIVNLFNCDYPGIENCKSFRRFNTFLGILAELPRYVFLMLPLIEKKPSSFSASIGLYVGATFYFDKAIQLFSYLVRPE